MTVARLEPGAGRLTWMGVGNVEAILLRADSRSKTHADRVILRSGLVGFHLPELRATTVPIGRGDLIVFATDGIAVGFSEGLARQESAQKLADDIVARHFKATDDALALVVRYLGDEHEKSNG